MVDSFAIADRYVDEVCALKPVVATSLGVEGHDHEWGESFGMAGVEANTSLGLRYRSELKPHLDDSDPRYRLAARIIIDSIDESLDSYEQGDHFRDLRHLGSPFHHIRMVFDIMPVETAGDWANITSRLETIDQAYGDYRDRLDKGRRHGITSARRQVLSIIEQARHLAGEESAFLGILGRADKAGHLSSQLEAAVDHAMAAAAGFADWLEGVYLPQSQETDGVGEETYRRSADRLVGLEVDPEEAYRWGWEEFHRLLDEMSRVGKRILPGENFASVRDFLEADPDGLARSPDELVVFVDRLLREAVDDLAGDHFDVPAPIRPLTVRVAPPGGPLAAYYRAPSEDFSRPGGVWYSIGDQKEFPLYQHVSTAYHEGFPGHHLQMATAMYHKEDLSRVQRVLTWYPGYGEGWGMYSEVLMGELGYLEDPRHYFGMLAKQMYRAARIVVDIGLHLAKSIPNTSVLFPGEHWTFDRAVEFMRVYGFRTPAQAEAEVLRYLGWPGQAIAYKLGEREILYIREEVRRRLGGAFDLREFHAAVLNSGPMRLDLLRPVVKERLG